MGTRSYAGIEAFGEDAGTLFPPSADLSETLDLSPLDDKKAKRQLRSLAKGHPVVWFVDDERANREWFSRHHQGHFAVVTFSSRRHVGSALKRGLKCDAIVTDIFFPARPIKDNGEADRLLAIYTEIGMATVSELPSLWARVKEAWSLDGFSIARDGAYHRPPIPVFLFSRKATLLLGVEDFVGEPPSIANSYWLLEKVDPNVDSETARKASQIQRDRIVAVLGTRSSKWRGLLRSMRVGSGGVSVDLKGIVPEG